MLAARVEQKNGMTKDYKKWRDALDKESPIQAGCETRTSGSVRGAEKQFNELQTLKLGADDYITKPIDFDILETIINARLAGVARNRLADAVRHDISPEPTNLNDREAEILTWAARGKTSAQIAEVLDITKRTVDFHLDNARVKLGASTRIEAAFKATMGGLIKP
jgi:DNA-binding NarL/FixJ family response regulator